EIVVSGVDVGAEVNQALHQHQPSLRGGHRQRGAPGPALHVESRRKKPVEQDLVADPDDALDGVKETAAGGASVRETVAAVRPPPPAGLAVLLGSAPASSKASASPDRA